jgi:hypothetical protein
VIVGAVNGDGFLTDPEGNRRYWVIDCPQAKDSGQFIDGPGAARDRDAIWKAAVLAYRAGAAWTLSTAEQAASNIRNGQWEAVDEWQDALSGWAEATTTPGGFTTREAISGAGLRMPEAITRADEMRAGEALKRAGFERQANPTRRPDGHRARHWVLAQPAQPGTTSDQQVVPAEISSPAVDLPSLAQPAQPISENLQKKSAEGEQGDGGAFPALLAKKVVPVVPSPQMPTSASHPGGTTSAAGGCAGCAEVVPGTLMPDFPPVGSGADAFDDGDDPAWGPRPEVQP